MAMECEGSGDIVVELLPADGAVSFKVSIAVVNQMRILKNMLEDVGIFAEAIPLPNVRRDVLEIVLEFCEKHRKDSYYENVSPKSLEMDDWDSAFILRHAHKLYGIVMAANYLEIGALLDVGCKFIVNSIRGKTPRRIREFLGIENDWDPEEYKQIMKENGWTEDD